MTQEAVQTKTLWLARIHIMRKAEVVDPQGNTVRTALHQLHFDDVDAVRIGKYIEVMVAAADSAAAYTQIEAMCTTLLANPVIEHYHFTIDPVQE